MENFDTNIYRKMDSEDVQGLLHMRRRAYALKNRRKKDREELKNEDRKEYDEYFGRD